MANSNTTNSYLTPPQLHGKRNSDGTYTLSELEMKAQSDFNYRVAKMLQGELNLKNLNADTNAVFNGKVSFVDLSTGGSTVINGDNITTGAINGITFISTDPLTDGVVEIENGSIFIKNGTTLLGQILPSPTLGIFIEASTGKYVYLSGKVQVGMYDEVGINGSLIKLASGGNMSIDSSGTIYIGSSAGYTGNVEIGQAGGRIDLNCDVYYKGVLLT